MQKKQLFANVFATPAMSCCGKKSMKIKPTSFQKQLSNQHSNLHRFGSRLGPMLGGFWEPRWGQVGTKSLQKSIFKPIIKTITFRIALGADFDRFWAPKWLPRGGPRNRFSRFWGLLGPSWGHLGAKMAPDPSKRTSVTDLGASGIDF